MNYQFSECKPYYLLNCTIIFDGTVHKETENYKTDIKKTDNMIIAPLFLVYPYRMSENYKTDIKKRNNKIKSSYFVNQQKYLNKKNVIIL